MINVSKKFKEMLLNDEKHYLLYLDIVLSDGTVLNLDRSHIWSGGFEIDDAVSSDNSFDIGAAIINSSKFTLNNIYDDFSAYDFEKAKISASIGLEMPDGSVEKIKKGEYTVDDPKYNGSLISLLCYDNMVLFDRPYSDSELVYPATLGQIVRDACTVCGVTLQSTTFPNSDYIVESRPVDEAITFREVIRWSAQIACCFARCDTQGRLELKWYNQTVFEQNSVIDGGSFSPWTDNGETLDGGTFNPWTNGDEVDGGSFAEMQYYHHIFSTKSMSVGTDDVVITGVKVLEKNTSSDYSSNYTEYFTGKAGYVIEIKDNMLIQNGKGLDVSNYIGQRLIGFSFRKATVTHVSDPTIEAGDIAYLSDHKNNSYPILISSTRFVSNDFQKSSSNAADVAKKSAQRYTEATKNYVELRKQLKVEKTEREKALQNLSKLLENASGAYTTIVEAVDGGRIYYLHNKPLLSDSDIVWKMTSEAWGVSTDGGKTWNAGMTVDGDTIVRILTATGVNADWINAGEILVTDSSGKTIFSVNMNTKTVLISGDNVVIGGESATKAIENALKTAQSALAISITLDNEYQGIPTDYLGNYTTFPTTTSKVTVYYGHEDVSDMCTYSINKSSGVSATFDDELKIINVTDLTEETGYVDVTATYLNILVATKRFAISKIKGGQKGDSGRTYFLELTSNVIKRYPGGALSPENIICSAYYRDGNSATKNAVVGTFVMDISPDGDSWTTVKTSSGTTINSYFYASFLKDDTAFARITFKINDVALDVATITILTDMDNLDQETIFNLLTNGGETQGIYLKDGKVYVNGEYIKSASISGESIAAKSVTADKMNVEDLNALDATIGGWNIDETGIYKTVNAQYEVRFQPLTNDMLANETPILFCAIDGLKKFVLWANGSTDFGDTHIYSDGSILAKKVTSKRYYSDTSFAQIVIEDSYFKFWDLSTEIGYMEPLMEQWIEDGMTNVNYVLETDMAFRCSFVEQTSDERKKNITEWDSRYEDFILNINPINFTWNDNSDQRQHTGIGAQSAKMLMKELGIERNGLVSGSEEKGYSVSYSELHAMQIAVIQKQEKRINELEKIVQQLVGIIQ